VGLVWFCTKEILEEDLEDTYNIRQVNNCVVICVLWKGKMVEEFPCVLHAIILLGGVESNLV